MICLNGLWCSCHFVHAPLIFTNSQSSVEPRNYEQTRSTPGGQTSAKLNLGMWNSLAMRKTVYPKMYQNVSFSMPDLFWKFHENLITPPFCNLVKRQTYVEQFIKMHIHRWPAAKPRRPAHDHSLCSIQPILARMLGCMLQFSPKWPVRFLYIFITSLNPISTILKRKFPKPGHRTCGFRADW